MRLTGRSMEDLTSCCISRQLREQCSFSLTLDHRLPKQDRQRQPPLCSHLFFLLTAFATKRGKFDSFSSKPANNGESELAKQECTPAGGLEGLQCDRVLPE